MNSNLILPLIVVLFCGPYLIYKWREWHKSHPEDYIRSTYQSIGSVLMILAVITLTFIAMTFSDGREW